MIVMIMISKFDNDDDNVDDGYNDIDINNNNGKIMIMMFIMHYTK